MVTGVVGGSAHVRWAVRNPRIPLKRNELLQPDEQYDVDDIHLTPADKRPGPTPGSIPRPSPSH
ncbi:hypothetical protein [Gordonia sp. NB41Y]|uniref:hypothetical protein n=1 Tax=Gordonia sp. NB41Y TaxID=875808 RepID=UPI0021C8CB81|nr:hypothetical protein [Gordonia sp. NB41Y]WLP90502.1 hypothetical protein Q9K23_23870 [Gordonia sp. NB41Y]